MAEPLLLEDTTRRKLDRLTLISNRVRAGSMKGERRSKNRGTSIEFADYRNYAPGDDLRRLDWNVYARLERPYIKLLEDEEDLAVHILLDSSASMDWGLDGEENTNKFLFARRLFASLGYIALAGNDRLIMTSMNDHGLESFGPARGRYQTVQMLRYAHALKARGITDLNVTLKDYSVRSGRPGLCFIISDMFSTNGYVDGLNALVGKGYECVLLHVMSPDELTPPLIGDLRLVDVETGNGQEVSIDGGMRDLYIQRVQDWLTDIRAECNRRNVTYMNLTTDMPWEKVVLYEMRRKGLVK
ncbi:MAG: DUF58 domain-containing protein [Aggregatilineales bacterium]